MTFNFDHGVQEDFAASTNMDLGAFTAMDGWETVASGDGQQPSPSQSPIESTPHAFATVQLDEQGRPSMTHMPSPVDESPILLLDPHQSHGQHQQHHVHIQPHYRPHTLQYESVPGSPAPGQYRPQTHGSPIPGASLKASGVSRQASRTTRVQQQAHPYSRPSPSTLGTASPASPLISLPLNIPSPTAASTVNQRSTGGRKQSVRFESTPRVAAAQRGKNSERPGSPTVQPKSVANTSVDSTASRSSTASTAMQDTSMTSQVASDVDERIVTLADLSFKVAPAAPINICTDLHYSEDRRTLLASLEVPGVKRENLKVKLTSGNFHSSRYVCIEATRDQIFPANYRHFLLPKERDGKGREIQPAGSPQDAADEDEGQLSDEDDIGSNAQVGKRSSDTTFMIVRSTLYSRERRFGRMRRMIKVPDSTKPSDINAQLQDGVLTLAIHIGRLCDVQDLNEIPVH